MIDVMADERVLDVRFDPHGLIVDLMDGRNPLRRLRGIRAC
jgi:hypothetical protein